MPSGDRLNEERLFSGRDDEPDDSGGGGGGGGGMSYDDEDDEDGGWATNKDQSDSLWDSAEESDDEDDEEPGVVADAGEEEEDPDLFGTGLGETRRASKQKPTPPSKVIRLNVSLGLRFSMHIFIVFLAVSMGKPCIEPLLSMTKIISLGTIQSGCTRCGG